MKVTTSNIIKLFAGVVVGFILPKIIGVSDYGYHKTFTLYATYVSLLSFGIVDGIYLKYGGKNYSDLGCYLLCSLQTFLDGSVDSGVGVIYLELAGLAAALGLVRQQAGEGTGGVGRTVALHVGEVVHQMQHRIVVHADCQQG